MALKMNYLLCCLLYTLCLFNFGWARDDDRFNYYGTTVRPNGAVDYGPEEWGDLDCLGKDNIQNCLGYPDKWETAIEWDIDFNSCRWCPEGSGEECGIHHQSPIDLKRDRAIVNSTSANECIDLHWMKYEDSSCKWQQLVDANAFTVERHALRLSQPIEGSRADDTLRLGCPEPGVGRRFGKIDFSKGFSQWWFLSHIDFHVPSEHTQDGRRYSAEAQMYHFYSVSAEEAGVANELASVAVFFDASPEYPRYPYLDSLICQWRKYEDTNRAACGLDPIPVEYPGCFPNIPSGTARRNLREHKQQPEAPRFQTVFDVLDHNARNPLESQVKLEMDEENWGPSEMDEDEWKDWIEDQSRRNLIENAHLSWFNYFLMLGVRTEYYFRYEGTQTIPPCYGPHTPFSRGNTTHWRVLKDPIRCHPDQIKEMGRLIADRIAAPWEREELRCKPDTAALVSATGEVNTARPLQEYSRAHAMTFCECQDWVSKWPDDREWCAIRNVTSRFYEHPYNFRTNGL